MHSLRSYLGLFLFTASVALAADAVTTSVPELRGMLMAGSERRFALTSAAGGTAWVGIGESFDGWKVTDYRQADESLVLNKGGREEAIKLSSSVIAVASDTKATLAEAEDVLRKMNFNQMMSRILEQQKKSSLSMIKQMAGQMGGTGASQEDFMAFQQKVMDTMFAELQPDSLQGDVAKIYSEVYTKDELQAQADFYSTAAGQAMVDKQPDVQQKMSELMMPRIMAAMPKIQAMAKDFAQQQAANKAAATPAPAPAPAPAN